jgi:hypothetical protein
MPPLPHRRIEFMPSSMMAKIKKRPSLTALPKKRKTGPRARFFVS